MLPIALLVGCSSSDDSSPATAGAGGASAGAGGTSVGGSGVGGSKAGGSGAGGSKAGSGGTTAGAAGTTAGAGGSKAGSAGAGAGGTVAAGAGGSGGGKAGSAGTGAGGKAGAGGSGDGPQTCDASHGNIGCCSADGATNYYFDGNGVVAVDCASNNLVCTWTGKYYDCGPSPAVADPSGADPLACGAPLLPSSVSGCMTSCTANADCTATADTPICDTTGGSCVGCVMDADCAGNAKGTSCDPGTHTCFHKCATSTDCKDAAAPVCNPATTMCVACVASTDCKDATKPICDASTNACVGCVTSFDCKDPTKAACDTGLCKAESACTGDDTHEDADDGPLGATELTPTSGDTSSATDHKICGIPAAEADYFKFTASDGDDVTLTLDWMDTSADLDIVITDDKGNTLGIDYYLKPAVVKLDYLAKGTYYVSITSFDPMSSTPAATPYTLAFARTTGNKCATIADCAKDGQNAILRGYCNPAVGACTAIDGKGAVAKGGVCDSGDDCTSGLCAETPFNQDADKFAFCTTGCTMDTDCSSGQVCTTVFKDNYCTAKCTKDEDCAADTNSAPTGTGPWAYLTCDKTTGTCAM